jgi:hypothetical protein
VRFKSYGCPFYNVTLSLSVLLFVAAVPLPNTLNSKVLENTTEDLNSDYDEGSTKLLEDTSGVEGGMEGNVEAHDDAKRSVISDSWPKDPPLQAESVR